MAGILKQLGVESIPSEADASELDTPLEELQFEPNEREMELAAAHAEQRKASAAERVRLWLELAVLHRNIALKGPAGQKRARLKQAELVVRRALEIAAQAKDSLGYLSSVDTLAEVLLAMKNYPSTEKLLREGIRLEASLAHPDPLRTARRIHLLGLVHYRAGKAEDAVPVLEQAVKLHEDTFGAEHDETVRILAELGAVHRARGRQDMAQVCLKHALRYYQKAKGVTAPEAIETLSQLVGSFEDSDDRESAAGEYERMLTLVEREVGRSLDDTGEMQFSVASVYIRWGEYTRARELLCECIGTFRRGGGARLAVGHETLAHAEEALGHYSDAVRELANAGKAWAKCKNRNAELVVNMNYRADLLDQLKRKKEAEWLREQVAELEAEAAQKDAAQKEAPLAQHAMLRPSSA
jgi:tetratricopeptide (TPR) repeat protein